MESMHQKYNHNNKLNWASGFITAVITPFIKGRYLYIMITQQ